MREIKNNKIVEADNRACETYKEIVTSAALDALGSKKSYRGRKKIKPWWTEEVNSAVKEKMEWFRPEDRREYELTRKRADQVKKKKECGKKCENIRNLTMQEE